MEEKTIEELLNTIPLTITKKIKDRCFSCGSEHEKRVEYNLKIYVSQHEIRPNVVVKHFKMFYYTTSFSAGDSRKYIGHACGLGFKTLNEAFEELKGYLKENDY